MSKTIYITDESYNDGATCTRSYYVEVKLASEDIYQPLQSGLNVQYSSPIEVPALDDDLTYNVRITRTCCDGTIATPYVVTVLTTQLAAPATMEATATGATTIDLEWDVVSNADNYSVERAEASDYSDAEVIYDGPLLEFDDTGLTTATTYYYRVRAFAADYLAGTYITDSATTS